MTFPAAILRGWGAEVAQRGWLAYPAPEEVGTQESGAAPSPYPKSRPAAADLGNRRAQATQAKNSPRLLPGYI